MPDLAGTPAATPAPPLTWGQRAMLPTLRDMGADSGHFTLVRTIRTPRPAPVGWVRRALSDTALRFDALRTVLHAIPGDHRQSISDEPSVDLVEVGVDGPDSTVAACRDAAASLRRRGWDPWRDTPFRAVLVTEPAGVAAVVLGVSHLVADAAAIDVVAQSVEGRLAGGGPGDDEPAWQPADQAAFEASTMARRGSDRAVARWSALLDGLPAGPPPPSAGAPDRFQEWSIGGPRAAAAVAAVATRTSCSPASVVLAAWCHVIAAADPGRGPTAVTLISGNRHRAREHRYVGPLAQDTLFTVDRARSADVDDRVRLVHRRALDAYSNGRYDPAQLEEVLGSGTGARKVRTFFNFARRLAAADPVPGADGHSPRPRGQWPFQDLTRFLVAQPVGGRLDLRLVADTGVAGQAAPAELLVAVRDALVAAAGGAFPLRTGCVGA